MSVTSEELNYLIWRYLQEAGHEVTAFALQDETKIHELDERYSSRIHIGCLVDLVQKGILYCEEENLVNEKGQLKTKKELENLFNLFGAIDKNPQDKIKFTGRFALSGPEAVSESQDQPEEATNNTSNNSQSRTNNDIKVSIQNTSKQEEEFIQVLTKSKAFSPSLSANWNPVAPPVLSWGEHNSTAKIAVLQDTGDTIQETVTLTHPLGVSVDLSVGPGGEKEEITVVSWAPKGHFLLTGSENGELRLWTAEGKLRNVLTLHHSAIISVKWNEDSTFILTQDDQNNTIIWDANSGTAIQHIDYEFLKSHASSTTVQQTEANFVSLGTDATWLDNAKFAIPGLNGTIALFQVTERTPIGFLHGHTAPIGSLKYSKHLQLLASGSDDTTVRIWKGNSTSSAQVLLGHDQGIVSADWLQPSAEKPLILSSSLDGSVRVWDVYSGELLLASFLDGVPIFESALSPDNKWYAVATEEGIVSIFDVSSATLDPLISSFNNENTQFRKVGHLRTVAQYQPEKAADKNDDSDYVSCVSWSSDSNKLCVSYNKSETIIIDWKKD